MFVPCNKTSNMVPKFYTLRPLTLKFDLLLKNFNLGCYLVIVAVPERTLIPVSACPSVTVLFVLTVSYVFCKSNYQEAAVVKWLSSCLVEQGVWVYFPCLAATISGIGYLLLPSGDMVEIT